LTPDDSYDVAIVGAGLAGLECARRLCGAGLRVLFVDRKPDISRSVHTTGIFVRRTLEEFDLPESCLGPPIRHVVLHSPARRPLTLSSPDDEFRVGRMGALYDRRLVECLNLGVHWSPSTLLKGIEANGSSSRVTISIRGRARSVSARYVVGADGVASATARALGLDVNRRWIVGAEDVFRGAPGGGPPRFHCFLDPDLAPGYLAWIVDDGRETHVGVGGIPGRIDMGRSLELFRREAGLHVDLREPRLVERRGGPIPVGGVLRSIANHRGLLVGDAAGAPSPLTAGGLDSCLRLSALACSVIVRHLGGDPSALQDYSGGILRRRFRLRLALRAAMDLTTSRTVIELGCFLLRNTPLRAVASRIFFGNASTVTAA
jgi:flavin-dependent dehydrogenase